MLIWFLVSYTTDVFTHAKMVTSDGFLKMIFTAFIESELSASVFRCLHVICDLWQVFLDLAFFVQEMLLD